MSDPDLQKQIDEVKKILDELPYNSKDIEDIVREYLKENPPKPEPPATMDTRETRWTKEDSRFLHEQYEVMLIKMTVLTETIYKATRLGQQGTDLLVAASKAMDEKPADWWKERSRRGLTLKQWAEEFLGQ